MEYDTYISYFYNTGVAIYDQFADYSLTNAEITKTYALYQIINPVA